MKIDIQPNGLKIWEAFTLKQIIDEVILDPRFVGLAGYIVNIRFFWSYEIPTACAGHGFIFFNPDFYAKIPEETRKTVLAREIWHLILKHLERGKLCDPFQHNIAADHVININLEKSGFTFEGTDPCKDLVYDGMSTEQVYNIIYKKKPEDRPKPDLSQHVSSGKIEEMVGDVLVADKSGKTLDAQKASNDEAVDAEKQYAGLNTGSSGIQLDLTTSKIIIVDATYPEIFKKYLIDPLTGGRRTFMRPNRRQVAMKGNTLRLPGRYPKKGHLNRLTHLVYALDVSGSISHVQAQQFHDSVRTLKDLLNPEKLTVLFFDTKIRLKKTFTDKQPYSTIKVTAGGGTSLKDVYLETAKLDPEALVIFTDLCVSIPPEPKWDTIWLVPKAYHSVPANLYGDLYLIPERV